MKPSHTDSPHPTQASCSLSTDTWNASLGVVALICWILTTVMPALAAPVVPETVICQEAFEYTAPDGRPLLLNMATPRHGAGPFAAVVCIHGGGFRAGKRESHDALCVKLAERSYVAATVSYRIDPTRIGALGTSAGGSLAELLGVTAHVPRFEGDGGNADQPSDVACVVNIYGANDFTRSYGRSNDAHVVLSLWFGGA